MAGDELVDWRNAEQFTPETKELLVATGFLRSAADDTDEKELTTPDILNGVLQRTSEVVASNLLGLTVGCAKCHDHKYEPIPQRDYYSLLAAFTPVFNPAAWVPPKDRALADIAPVRKAEAEKHNAEIDRQSRRAASEQSDDIRRQPSPAADRGGQAGNACPRQSAPTSWRPSRTPARTNAPKCRSTWPRSSGWR